MAQPVPVRYPAPFRYVPARARNVRFGYAEGLVHVEMREFEVAPVPLCASGGREVFSAEGRAWTRPRRLDGAGIAEAELRHALAADVLPAFGPLRELADYLHRSPLSGAETRSKPRLGDLDRAALGSVRHDGTDEAAAEVRAFLDGRVRIHRGEVWLRYERLVLIERSNGSPDGIHAAFPANPRDNVHPYGAARILDPSLPDANAWIPPECLDGDVALWMATALPSRLLFRAEYPGANWPGFHAKPGPGSEYAEAEAGLAAMRPELVALERMARTASITGDRLLPALRTLREAARLAENQARAAHAVTGFDGTLNGARHIALMREVLDREVVPPLDGTADAVRDDGATLAAMAVP